MVPRSVRASAITARASAACRRIHELLRWWLRCGHRECERVLSSLDMDTREPGERRSPRRADKPGTHSFPCAGQAHRAETSCPSTRSIEARSLRALASRRRSRRPSAAFEHLLQVPAGPDVVAALEPHQRKIAEDTGYAIGVARLAGLRMRPVEIWNRHHRAGPAPTPRGRGGCWLGIPPPNCRPEGQRQRGAAMREHRQGGRTAGRQVPSTWSRGPCPANRHQTLPG